MYEKYIPRAYSHELLFTVDKRRVTHQFGLHGTSTHAGVLMLSQNLNCFHLNFFHHESVGGTNQDVQRLLDVPLLKMHW